MEVINVYPEYDGEGYDCEGYDGTDIHSIHFLTEKLMMLRQIKLLTVVKMCIQMR